MKLAEIADPDDHQCVPRIDRAEVRLLWHDDFWDGPLSGMLSYRGGEYWFEMVAESEDDAAGWYLVSVPRRQVSCVVSRAKEVPAE